MNIGIYIHNFRGWLPVLSYILLSLVPNGFLVELCPAPVPEASGGGPSYGTYGIFLTIGEFDTENEAHNCLTYIKSKFTRALLGVLKITQHNSRSTWSKVPLQDFTSQSDLDWTKSIPEIDHQVFDKYGLDGKEIAFVEEKVKEMGRS